MKTNDLELLWLGHASFKIRAFGKVIYIDPYQLIGAEKADLILITHSHFDHCSQKDADLVTKDGTIFIIPPDCQSKIVRIPKKLDIILSEPGKEITIPGLKIKIKVVPAYNTNKQFHQKSEKWVGYVLQIGSTVIYHAGDTDLIKEMQDLAGYGKKGNTFIALLPIGGMYTMTAEEAAKAASIIKPTIAIPMHYGSVVGCSDDAKKFRELCEKDKIKVEILEKN